MYNKAEKPTTQHYLDLETILREMGLSSSSHGFYLSEPEMLSLIIGTLYVRSKEADISKKLFRKQIKSLMNEIAFLHTSIEEMEAEEKMALAKVFMESLTDTQKKEKI